jgi:hypothetical protein
MKATVTCYRTYHKEITYDIEIKEDVDKGEDLCDTLLESIDYALEEWLFNKAEFEDGEPLDTDRYDVYDEEGKQITGGHL